MFGRVKNAVSDLFHKSAENNENKENHVSSKVSEKLHAKLVYQRPLFLGLDESEEKNAVDNKKRIPVTPKDINSLPFNSGYCEICNAGKTLLNEDCAVALTINIDVEQKYQTTCESCELNENNDHREANHVVKSDTANHINGDDSNHVKVDATNQIQADSTVNVNEDLNSNEVESKTTESKAIPIKTQDKESVHNDSISSSIRVDYFAIFDGHAGTGAALYASAVFHQILVEKLKEVRNLLVKKYATDESIPNYLTNEDSDADQETHSFVIPTNLYSDSLITGILQNAMIETDQHLEGERHKWKINGGCTALVVVFIMGKLYVAGAGDCRAVLCRSVPSLNDNVPERSSVIPMSQDFTPTTERRRLQYLAYIKPLLIGTEFTRLEFIKKITKADIGKKVLYRDYHMTGWGYKVVSEEDVRYPLIQGSGKSGRLLGTIGVTRGLGDHDIVALNFLQHIPLKPFLSSVPEVRTYDVSSRPHGDKDVLILGSDGLWDVIPNELANQIVSDSLNASGPDDPLRYRDAARALALRARGEPKGDSMRPTWRMLEDRPASVDDITVFVIPLLPASFVHR